MESAASALPALIGLDWGTSSLRAYLMDANGTVIGERSEPWGIMHLGDRDFAGAHREVIGQWTEADDLPVIACGMVGSAQGWVEAPYCPAPAGAEDLARSLTIIPGTRVHIVAGVAQRGQPDVMRGEETQIIGALSRAARMAQECRVVCPGSHSKWVTVRNGHIAAFTTYMTGELYSVLSEHSILGRFAHGRTPPDPADASDAFRLGVQTARDSEHDSASLLFSARARVLLGGVRPDASLAYLSGVLIGSEVRSGLSGEVAPEALIGAPALCSRYADALREFDVVDVDLVGDSAARGLWAIATEAQLCSTSTPRTNMSR